jgi:hypothetical protein
VVRRRAGAAAALGPARPVRQLCLCHLQALVMPRRRPAPRRRAAGGRRAGRSLVST